VCRLLAETIRKVRPDALVALEVVLQEDSADRAVPTARGGTVGRQGRRSATGAGTTAAARRAGVQVSGGVVASEILPVQGSSLSSSSSRVAASAPTARVVDNGEVQAEEETKEGDELEQRAAQDSRVSAAAVTTEGAGATARVRGRVAIRGSNRGGESGGHRGALWFESVHHRRVLCQPILGIAAVSGLSTGARQGCYRTGEPQDREVQPGAGDGSGRPRRLHTVRHRVNGAARTGGAQVPDGDWSRQILLSLAALHCSQCLECSLQLPDAPGRPAHVGRW
jgi:hypothetical protein